MNPNPSLERTPNDEREAVAAITEAYKLGAERGEQATLLALRIKARAAQAKPDVEAVRATFNEGYVAGFFDGTQDDWQQEDAWNTSDVRATVRKHQASGAVEVVKALREAVKLTKVMVALRYTHPNPAINYETVEKRADDAITAADQWLAREGA